MRDFRHLLQCKQDLHSSGVLCNHCCLTSRKSKDLNGKDDSGMCDKCSVECSQQ